MNTNNCITLSPTTSLNSNIDTIVNIGIAKIAARLLLLSAVFFCMIPSVRAAHHSGYVGAVRAPIPAGGVYVQDIYNFYKGECTSYCAYRLNQIGLPFTNWYLGQHFSHGKTWKAAALAANLTVNTTPALNAVLCSTSGTYGHVAFVDSINTDGSANISEYNFSNTHQYTTRSSVRANGTTTYFIHFRAQPNRAPVFNTVQIPTTSAGAINVSFSASDPDGNSMSHDIYIFTATGSYTGIRATNSSRVVNQSSTTSYSFPISQLSSLTNGGRYKVRVNIFDSGSPQLTAERMSGEFTYTSPTTSNPVMALSISSVSLSVTQYGSLSPTSFTIRNSGSGTLSYSASSNAYWMSVSPSSGTSTGETDTLNVNFNTSGYSAQTLNGMITVNGGSAGSQTISVRVTITAASSTNTDDHGNFTWNATTLSRYSSLAGNLESGGDEDMFRITVSSTSTVSFYSTGSSSVDTYGHLYNASGTQIAANDDSNGNAQFIITATLAPGTYYLKVRGYSSSTTGAYRVYAN